MIEEGNLFKKKRLKMFHKNLKDQTGASVVAEILENPKIIWQWDREFAVR